MTSFPLWAIHVYAIEIKKLASYRVDFWLRLVFVAVVRVLLAYFLWDAVFREMGTATVDGYTFQGLIYYFIVAALVSNMVHAGIDNIASEVYDGTLTRYLLYPTSLFLYKAMTVFAHASLASVQLIVGLALTWLIAGTPHDVALSFESCVLGYLASFVAIYLYRILQALLELMSFWVDAVWGLLVALYFIINFLGGGLIPLAFFPPWAQTILSYTPFPYLISFPVNLFLGKVPHTQIANVFFTMGAWCVVLTFVASLIWKRGLRRYSSVGI